MQIADILTPDNISCNVHVNSKKRVLELMGGLIATSDPSLVETEIFECLVERERLGSTGLGKGVAIPHGRTGTSNRAIGAFVKLSGGVDFDAVDNEPVDLIFALLIPDHFSDEHLQILSLLAQMFSDKKFCDSIRKTEDATELYRLIALWKPHAESA